MTLFLLFVSAQMAGNGIACLIAAAVWHITRPRLVDISKASRLDGVDSYVVKTPAELKPC